MDSQILLLCTHGSSTVVVRVFSAFSRMNLIQNLCDKWSYLTLSCLTLSYCIPGYNKCLLDNEVDFQNILCLARSKAISHIDVTVEIKNNHVDGVPESVGNVCVVDQMGLDEAHVYESDLLPMFLEHNDKVLLSASWANGITKVGHGFRGFRFKYVKNDSVRVTAIFSLRVQKGCMWSIHAKSQVSNGFFYIRKLNNTHTCGEAVRTLSNPRVGSELVSNAIADRVRDKPLIRPMDVVYDFKTDYGLDISYCVVWLGIEKARGELHGAHSLSFDQLRWYTAAVIRCNPGSFVDLHYDSCSKRFKSFFISFSACMKGFNHCRPLLFLDGTFLKGRYKGHLLAATEKDGNQGLFPLDFVIVDSENEENWLWFLQQLDKIVDKARTITFVSDRNLGLVEAMPKVFPTTHHGYCLQHLKANVRDKLKGYHNGFRDEMVRKLNECAYAPTVSLFHEELSELKEEGRGRLDDFFDDLPHHRWENAYFRGQRYGEMSSNAAESFNSWIRDARHLPITRLVDAIRNQIMTQMADRREKSKVWNVEICPILETKLQAAFATSRSWIVSKSNDVVFEVHSFPSVTVDIARCACSCYQWQLNGFPCAHAVVAILKSGNDLNTCVDRYFHVQSYRDAYSESIYPIPTADKPNVTNDDFFILPPLVKRPPGRPKKERILSKGEKHKRIRCGRCGRMGSHNRKSCKEPI